jgi:hypothetical protein
MRVGEFWEALSAYRENQSEERRHTSELARGAALRLWNLQVDKKHRISDPVKFWRMPWDDIAEQEEEMEVKRLTSLSEEENAEEARKFFERIHHGER